MAEVVRRVDKQLPCRAVWVRLLAVQRPLLVLLNAMLRRVQDKQGRVAEEGLPMARFTVNDVFYFCGHTGEIWTEERQAPSNFYVYILPNCERHAIEEVVKSTRYVAGTGYKDFSAEFLRRIGEIDRATRRRLAY